MTRKKSSAQRIFWIISLLVVVSMVVGVFISFIPSSRRSPSATPTPSPTFTPLSRTAPGEGGWIEHGQRAGISRNGRT
ncbi:MAG: hypothetical protein JW900_01845 [Anaerolineae bacterium]|nr:hypothetical protein [Anaerolineae bacterium]